MSSFDTYYFLRYYDTKKVCWIKLRRRFHCIGDLVKYANSHNYQSFHVVETGRFNYTWGQEHR